MTLRTKQIISYIVTFVVYMAFLPWYTTLILMGGIAFHESGHLWAARKMGLQSNGFYLFPFIGGLALSHGPTYRYSQRSFIVLMGPIWGAALALLTYVLFLITKNPIIGEGAQLMAYFNLFNLLPLSFLDGGQLWECTTYSVNTTLGVFALIVSTIVAVPVIWFFNPIIAIIMGFFGLPRALAVYKEWKMIRLIKNLHSEDDIYALMNLPHRMNKKQIFQTVGSWLATAAILGAIVYLTNKQGMNIDSLFKR